MENDGKTLGSERREEQQLKRLSGPIESMVLEIEAMTNEKEEVNDKSGEMVGEADGDEDEESKVEINEDEKEGTFSKVFGEMEEVLNEVIKVVTDEADKAVEPVEVFDRINELAKQAEREGALVASDPESMEEIEEHNKGLNKAASISDDEELRSECSKVPTIEIDYVGDQDESLKVNEENISGMLGEEVGFDEKSKAGNLNEEAATNDDTESDQSSEEDVKDDEEALMGQIEELSEEVKEVTTHMKTLSGEIKSLSDKEPEKKEEITTSGGEEYSHDEEIDFDDSDSNQSNVDIQFDDLLEDESELDPTELANVEKELFLDNDNERDPIDDKKELLSSICDEDSSQVTIDTQFDDLLKDNSELDLTDLANVEEEMSLDNQGDPKKLLVDDKEDIFDQFEDNSSRNSTDIQFDDLLQEESELDPVELVNVEKEMIVDNKGDPKQLFVDDKEDLLDQFDDNSSHIKTDIQFDDLLQEESELDPAELANVENEKFVENRGDPKKLFVDDNEDLFDQFDDNSSQNNLDIQFDDLLGDESELDPTEVANVEKELFGDDTKELVEPSGDDEKNILDQILDNKEDPVESDFIVIQEQSNNRESENSINDNTDSEQIKVLSQDLEEDFSTLHTKAPSPDDYDSPSSGVGSSTGGWTSSGTGGWGSGVGSTNGVSTVSIRADLEEEMSSSINRVRKLAEEKAKAERIRHQEEMDGLHRERALERKNFQLRLEQFQTEKDQMKNEIMTLREKVKLLHLEKENTEEQLLQLAEQNEQVAVQEQEEQPSKEEELLIQIDQLSGRVTSQDSELAEVREDNAEYKRQNKKLKEAMQNINKDKDNRFRIFGAAKEPVPSYTDPSWDDPTDVRKRVRRLEEELADQREVNNQLKAYVGEVLVNIMVKNPQILEKN